MTVVPLPKMMIVIHPRISFASATVEHQLWYFPKAECKVLKFIGN
jgi:hypothetical protein